MPFDYKKEYKEYYQPPKKPSIVTVPPMNFVAVRGKATPTTRQGSTSRRWSCCMGWLIPSR